MLAHEVAVVNKVVRRERAFMAKVDVTAIAVAQRPLVPVLVASEATRHGGHESLGPRLGYFDVAAHAVAIRCAYMVAVFESQMLLRKLDTPAHVRLAVTTAARALVVRLGVAALAIGVGREVERSTLAGARHAGVALDAVDPVQDVRTVLEGMRRRGGLQPEDARAGRQQDRDHHDEREPRPHRVPTLRPGVCRAREPRSNICDTRTSASVS
jgi:hypothetical protein